MTYRALGLNMFEIYVDKQLPLSDQSTAPKAADALEDLIYHQLPTDEADAMWRKINSLAEQAI